jgi:hypothetical protein
VEDRGQPVVLAESAEELSDLGRAMLDQAEVEDVKDLLSVADGYIRGYDRRQVGANRPAGNCGRLGVRRPGLFGVFEQPVPS